MMCAMQQNKESYDTRSNEGLPLTLLDARVTTRLRPNETALLLSEGHTRGTSSKLGQPGATPNRHD